ncbi:cell surface protein SprA [Dysgonomonas sp. ZJ279]|uniref:T9SS outer membrane translocon Sov/SprA n=1 Tax=Dysgonomonas sp. ZJ279 TaxID=2709796 RepID=UPI0021082408|nr:cell surface protein SprA [Dysgonomonas sp. ZJ279]
MLSGISGRVDTSLLLSEEPFAIPSNDTAPRFPVKKTQISTYDDLNNKSPIDLKDPSNVQTRVDYDIDSKYYIIRTKVGDQIISTPFSLSADEYMNHSLKQSMADYFRRKNALSEDGKSVDDGEFSLKDIKINIGPAERLFGPGGVKIKTQGYVETSMGFRHTYNDNPTLAERNRSRTAFDFKEDIQMNVSASVGEKVNFGMNYDTKSMFDFDSKRIKLGYDGKEDEIIKHIEAGNVSMATTNSLIGGNTALFGIQTELQFGKLRVNTLVSQQESQSKSISANGGVQTNSFEFNVDQYDESRHFFLAHYFRDNYDKAMSKIPFVLSPITITHLEVWVTNKRSDFTQARNIVGFADIAEHKVIKNPTRWTPTIGAPDVPDNGANNLYSTVTTAPYSAARNISQVNAIFNGFIESGLDYEQVESARLLNESEYTFNPQLGYVSLSSALQPDEVLAVAFEYKMNGNVYQVGEFATDIVDRYDASNPRSGALFLKLLKPVGFGPQTYTWDLMMKNVYSIGATNIQKDKFRMNISYQSDSIGTFINYLPEGDIRNQLLLRVMNLDRLDVRDNRNPDGIFDYIDGFTIRSENGRIYFPVVEPFGSHLRKEINNPAIADRYVYQELYDSTKTIAQQIAEKNKFKISGSYRGSASNSDINLNATNVPQGSVKVTAGTVTLTEGVDYIVDYMSGIVTIINQNILDTNTPIQISLEDRTFSMERKTLLGLNLSYDISKNFNVGGTIMHLSERPLTMKTELGNESVKNTLWGLNTSYRTESQWLTNLVDKLPFVNATQPSQITFNGEFAQMIAGHYENRDLGAHSYLDDFETSESRIDIKSPFGWTLASTPADKSGDALFPEALLNDDVRYGMNRAMMSWYMIDGIFTRRNSSLTPLHIKNDKDQLSDHFVREIYLSEIYPNRDVPFNEAATIPTLNLSYYPNERGQYNLDATNINSDGNLLNPKKRWAGITRKMDVRDFESANIEYIEFWLMDPFVYNDTAAVKNNGGDLYINLGEISEDVLKDGKKFYENGLPINDDPTAYTTTAWGKVPTRQSTVYAFDDSAGDSGRKKQDVGLNGLSAEEETTFGAYRDYLEALRSKLSPSALEAMQNDQFSPLNSPSKDKYHFYRSSDYDRDEVSIIDRYKFYNGTEGNSPTTSGSDESFATSARVLPDVEDIDQDNTMNGNETYFQYKLRLTPDSMKVGKNHIINSREVTVPLRNGTPGTVTWYQFKVPVRQYDKKIGNIPDFRSIRFMRMFLTGFDQTTFLRFGTFQLVRGDWRIYEQTLNKNDIPEGNGAVVISTVNIEENSDRKPVNYVLPPGLTRELDPDQTQLTRENEQALSLQILDLESGDARAVYKKASYDFRRHKRLQLFTHAEALVGDNTLAYGELTVFIRLGTDYKNNYYEYEIPLTITPPSSDYRSNSITDQYAVWPQDNMFDFKLDILKDLKLKRNKEKRKEGSNISFTKVYSDYDPDKPNNRVSIIGNPSLSDVQIIMIGVRNNSRLNKSGEVWVNELRLTDFNEEGGWAAQGNLNIALSDLGTINLSGRKETVGFGALDQSLMERRLDDYYMYDVTANVELGRFLPEKAKVSIPFYYAYSNQTTTPKYDPFDQDVTLKESLSIVDSKIEKDSIKSLSQEKTTTRSVSLNNIRVNIQSKTPMPYDPANFSLGYTFNQTEFKNPTTVYDVSKNYKATFAYSYSPLMKTWEPFKNSKSKSGSAKFAKSIGFNYLPSNIAFNSNMTRYYTETLLRDVDNYTIGENANQNQFLAWSQSFYWDRDFNINWDLTRNLKVAFQSGTRAEIEEPYLQVNKRLNRDDYDIWKDSVMQSIRDLGNPLSYKQIARVTYQLPFRNIPAMDWVTTNLTYTSAYQWDRGADIDSVEIGNTINNNITIDINNRFNLVSLYNKSGFLKRVNERFDSRRRAQSPSQQRREQNKEAQRRRFTQEVTLRTDTTITITHGLGTKNIELVAKKDGRPYNIKFKKIDENSIRINNKDSATVQINIVNKIKEPGEGIWKDIAEYSARGLMSFRSIGINYSRRKETFISGYSPHVGDAFGQKNTEYGLAPGLGFAFGFEGGDDFIKKSLDREWLVINSDNILPAVYNNSNKLEIRAQLEPFKGMKIELNANRENNERSEILYMFEGSPRTLGGSFSMTTIGLSTTLRNSSAKNGYQSDAFDRFLANRTIIRNRLESKYDGLPYPTGGFMTDKPGFIGEKYSAENNLVNINSGDVLIPAFLAAYTGQNANSVTLSAFPSLLSMLPNWTISYDGLSEIPAIKEKFRSIRFNHSYSCFYQVGSFNSFATWQQVDDDLGFIRDVLTGNPVPSSPYNIASVGISEIFNPLFGVEGILNNNMSINSQFNNMRTLNLNMASYQIIESIQKEIVVGFGYRIDEFNRVIGLTSKSSKDFNNDLNIKADVSHKTSQALIRNIQEQFTQATSGTTTVTLKLSADYTLSRSLTLRAFFDRIMNNPLISSTGYPTTNTNFGISLKFTLIQ